MPVLMKKNEWEKTIENAERTGRVWHERVVGGMEGFSLTLPAAGSFEVVFIEVPQDDRRDRSNVPAQVDGGEPCIRNFIGYGRRFHPEYRSTDDVMKELREGEADGLGR